MYLAAVPKGQRPNTSIAMEVVQGKGLGWRMVGAFTRSQCDDASLRMGEISLLWAWIRWQGWLLWSGRMLWAIWQQTAPLGR